MTEIIQGMTKRGADLLFSSQKSSSTIEFTKLKVGDGYITDETVSELNDLINEIDKIEIESTDIFDENGNVSMVVNGHVHQIESDFYFRELGLFAIDPETKEEVLYAYLNKGDNAGLIPMISSQAAVQEAVSMIVTIKNDANVIVNYKDEKGLINSGHNMFDIVMKDHILDDDEKRGLANFGEYVYKRKTDEHQGYPEFYNKCLEEYNSATEKTIRTSRNYITHGSVQVREDEFKENVIWSGFKRDSYIEQNVSKPFGQGDTIKLRIKTPAQISSKKGTRGVNTIFSMDNGESKFGLILGISHYQNKLILCASSDTTGWDITAGTSGKTSLEPETEYNIKLQIVDGTIKVFLKQVGDIDEIEDITKDLIVRKKAVTLPHYEYIRYGNCKAILDNTYYHKKDDAIYYAREFNGEIILIENGNYCTHNHEIKEIYNTITIKTSTNGHRYYDISDKSTIDNLYDETGLAWLYGIDTDNECIIIPRNNYYFMNGDSTTVGKMIKAGLPNIKGHFGGTESGADNANYLDGVFYNGSYNTNGNGGNNANDADVMYFDASRISSIYGNSTTVQTDAVKLIPYMVVGRISSFGVVGGTVILDDFISEDKLELKLEKFATKVDLDTKQNAGDYALKSDIAGLSDKAEKSDVYTKSEVDTKVASVYKYKGKIVNYDALPSENNVIGDVYELTINNNMYLWTGEKWLIIKDSFNSNDYVTITDFEMQIDEKADVASTLEGYGIQDAYTKDEIDEKIASVYRVKGSVENYDSLPIPTEDSDIQLTIGDVYNVLNTGANYVWTENGWDKLSETLDLSPFATKEELPEKVSELENDAGYLTAVPSGYITETELNAKNYLTSVPTEYITETELNNKNYQTSEQVQSAINTALGDIETLLDEINGGV